MDQPVPETTGAAMERMQYPIGRFRPVPALSDEERGARIAEIAALPGGLRAAVADLTPDRLETPYRPGGWTVRQVVHHVADSHVNAYIRFKLAATEQAPRITAYDQAAWAELADSREGGIEDSLVLLDALHRRWTHFLRSLGRDDWERSFLHPELGEVPLSRNLQLYAWHGRHHLAHITGLRERMGW